MGYEMNLKYKVLIVFVCSIIISMIPASAVEISSSLEQSTDNIKVNQANLAEDKNTIVESADTVDYHAKIIQDTVNEMNKVKWYQFWKWDFYLRQGPKKINDEGKIIESLSQNINKTGSNAEINANQAMDNGEKGIQIALNKTNQFNNSDFDNNNYNTGNDNENAQIIADSLSTHFKNKYVVTGTGTLETGDIVQVSMSHNNYVYLEYVGMNPSNDTALFIGDKNTAIRLPANDLKIQYKIASQTGQNTLKPSSINDSHSNTNKTLNVVNSPEIGYIDTIQRSGLFNYNKSGLDEYDNQIDSANKLKKTGVILIGVGTTLGAESILIITICIWAKGITGLLEGISWLCPLIEAGCATIACCLCPALACTSFALDGISATLLCTGGSIYDISDKNLAKLYNDKNAFINETNGIENDLDMYYDGEADNLPVSEDAIVDVEENGNTTGILNGTDKDGDGLIYVNEQQASNGTVIINKDGTYTYTPNKNFTGNDSFTYKSNDIYGDSNIATVTVIIHPVNHPPISSNFTFDTEINNNLTSAINVKDADGDIVTYYLLNSTLHGNITLNNNGTFSYSPENGFFGNDSFTYKTKDWKETGNIATVQINVHPSNQAPVSTDINYTMNKNNNFRGNLTATDEDKDTLSYKVETKPHHGNLILNSDGSFNYTPDLGFIGNDTFTYTAKDWKENSNIGTVKIEILNINHSPVVQDTNVNTTLNKEVKGIFKATDQDGDTLKYIETTTPSHGTLIINANQFVYTPDKNFIGIDTFNYKACDGLAYSTLAKVTINVGKNASKYTVNTTEPSTSVPNTNSNKNVVTNTAGNTEENSLNQPSNLNKPILPDISTKHPEFNQTSLNTPEIPSIVQNTIFQFLGAILQKATNYLTSLFK